jgi:hypothetical protein
MLRALFPLLCVLSPLLNQGILAACNGLILRLASLPVARQRLSYFGAYDSSMFMPQGPPVVSPVSVVSVATVTAAIQKGTGSIDTTGCEMLAKHMGSSR